MDVLASDKDAEMTEKTLLKKACMWSHTLPTAASHFHVFKYFN